MEGKLTPVANLEDEVSDGGGSCVSTVSFMTSSHKYEQISSI